MFQLKLRLDQEVGCWPTTAKVIIFANDEWFSTSLYQEMCSFTTGASSQCCQCQWRLHCIEDWIDSSSNENLKLWTELKTELTIVVSISKRVHFLMNRQLDTPGKLDHQHTLSRVLGHFWAGMKLGVCASVFVFLSHIRFWRCIC